MPNKTLLLTFLSCLFYSSIISAADTEDLHFHVVKKHGDSRHISMIPSRGYLANGKVRNNYDPNSVVYQQRILLKYLEEEQTELDRLADEAFRDKLQVQQDTDSFLERIIPRTNTDIIRSPGKNGLLEDLIELEKRGGKVKATE